MTIIAIFGTVLVHLTTQTHLIQLLYWLSKTNVLESLRTITCYLCIYNYPYSTFLWLLGGSDGKESTCNAEDWVGSLDQKRSPEKRMATHSSILAWRSPWTEDPGCLQSMGSQWVRHDWATSATFLKSYMFTCYFILFWRMCTLEYFSIICPPILLCMLAKLLVMSNSLWP